MDIIDFIRGKKDFILSLISDYNNSECHHKRSERVQAIRLFTSFKKFQLNALKDLEIISKQLGPSFDYQPYAEEISNSILVQNKIRDPDDILDYGGYWTVPVKIRPGFSIYKALDYLIMPEVLTEFLMNVEGISYKAATSKLYSGSGLPTTHHIAVLLAQNVSFNYHIKGIKMQCV